jgi:hypothetical protein
MVIILFRRLVGYPLGFKKTLMGIRKYLSKTTKQLWKYQQLWKRNVDYFKALILLEFYEFSPINVSFLEKKSAHFMEFQ